MQDTAARVPRIMRPLFGIMALVHPPLPHQEEGASRAAVAQVVPPLSLAPAIGSDSDNVLPPVAPSWSVS